MSDHIDTSDGTWREVPADTPAEAGRDRLVFDGVDRTRIWVKEEPVPPLPTEPDTLISVYWLHHTARPRRGRLVFNGAAWCAVAPGMGAYMPRELAEIITGFEVLAEPLPHRWLTHEEEVRRETAKAVLDRIAEEPWAREVDLSKRRREFKVDG